MDTRKLGRMPCISHLEILLVTNEPPWGYLYMSTSSMDGGDQFNPMVVIAHPEFSIQTSKTFRRVEFSGTL